MQNVANVFECRIYIAFNLVNFNAASATGLLNSWQKVISYLNELTFVQNERKSNIIDIMIMSVISCYFKCNLTLTTEQIIQLSRATSAILQLHSWMVYNTQCHCDLKLSRPNIDLKMCLMLA